MIFQFSVDIPFGELDPQITAFLTPASTVPASDFTVMLPSVSMLVVDEAGRQQAAILIEPGRLSRMFGTKCSN